MAQLRQLGLDFPDDANADDDSQWSTSLEARYSARGWARKGDVCFLRSQNVPFSVGEVHAFATVLGVHAAVVSLWDLVAVGEERLDLLAMQRNGKALMDLTDMIGTGMCKRYDGGLAMVLIPLHLR